MQYILVYDVLRGDSDWWFFPSIAGGVGLVCIAALVYFARNPNALGRRQFFIPMGFGSRTAGNTPAFDNSATEKRNARNSVAIILFLLLWAVGALLLTTFFLFDSIKTEFRARSALKNGKFDMVQGIVANFRPEPAEGHANEEFDVGDHHYSLSSASSTGGYHNTQPHGGLIRDGVPVRIADVDGVILRLEIANGTSAPASATEIAAARDSLLQLGVQDQAGRADIAGAVARQDTALVLNMMRADSARSRWLRAYVARAGWPLRSVVGDSAAEAAWLILQHTPYEDFQRAVLPELETLALKQEINSQNVALLKDRVLKHQNLPQEYGTQFDVKDGKLVPAPIRDFLRLDERRAAVGLPPMREYVRLLQENAKLPVVWPPQ